MPATRERLAFTYASINYHNIFSRAGLEKNEILAAVGKICFQASASQKQSIKFHRQGGALRDNLDKG
jgi:hypothetical protein